MFYKKNHFIQKCLIMLLISLFLISGCSKQPAPEVSPEEPESSEVETPEAESPEAESPEVPETETSEVETPEVPETEQKSIREQAAEHNQDFAVAYLGYMDFTSETVPLFLESKAEYLPILNEIPETNIVTESQYGEVYCLIPTNPEDTILVYSWDYMDDGETIVYEDLIYEGTGEDPYVFVCNASFYPEIKVQIGTSTTWYPQLDDYLFVSGENFLDFSPYNSLLLEQYHSMLNDPNSNWIAPAKEDLAGTSWYTDNYDLNGNYYLWKMILQENVMDVHWADGLSESNNVYEGAKWNLEHKDGISTLTIDFGQFAGAKSYNLLLDKDAEMMYIAVNATQKPIVNEWESQYRFLIPADTNWEAADMLGSWERNYVEVEGDHQVDEPGTCSALIFDDSDGTYYITYTNNELPKRSFVEATISTVPTQDFSWLEGHTWLGSVNYTQDEMTLDLFMTTEGELVIMNMWDFEGGKMVSYEYFQRP